MKTTQDAYRVKDRRIAQSKRDILAIFRRILPSKKPVTLPDDVADALRVTLVRSAVYMFPERYAVSHTPGPLPDDYFEEQGLAGLTLTLDPDLAVQLCNLLGLPHLKTEWHGDCDTCVFGPDRGYGSPCASCGTGHPCHIPKNPPISKREAA